MRLDQEVKKMRDEFMTSIDVDKIENIISVVQRQALGISIEGSPIQSRLDEISDKLEKFVADTELAIHQE